VTIDKTELEAKLREIEGVVTDIEEEAQSNAIMVAAVVTVVVVGVVAFIVWRSRRSRIRIEVYRQ
jgi:heme/copper-type cytochrome/quinol oxidase subunit 2